MKDYLFILSHKGAGSTLLARVLNSTEKVAAITNSGIVYDHIEVLSLLDAAIRNNFNVHSFKPIYCDTITHNSNFYCDTIYEFAKFIFLVREPNSTIKYLQSKKSYDYYRFRLRRLYEQSKLIKRSIVVTYNDIISRKAFPLIEEFLNLEKPISSVYYPWLDDSGDLLEGKLIEKTSVPGHFIQPISTEKYEKYLNRIRNNSRFVI